MQNKPAVISDLITGLTRPIILLRIVMDNHNCGNGAVVYVCVLMCMCGLESFITPVTFTQTPLAFRIWASKQIASVRIIGSRKN